MKEGLKKLFFGTFLTAIIFIFMVGVNALTIKETTNTGDQYDDIVDGTVVIGITKFEPEVIITALRASKATFNDVVFNYGKPGYKGVEIYYLLSGDWYNIDEDNNATPVEDEAINEALNNNDIYYVNNEEKVLEVPYSKELDDGYEFAFHTEDSTKDDEVTVENGVLKIPATVKKVEVFAKNTETGVETKLDVFEKDEYNDTEFDTVSSDGTISEGDPSVSPLAEYAVDGNTITIGGALAWYPEDSGEEREFGNYASVKITAPEIYNEEFLIANTTGVIDGGEPMNWVGDLYANLYLKFNTNKRSYTVTITWAAGNVQVFTVNLADDVVLALPPQGTIGKGDSTGGDLTYTLDEANHNKIIIDGNIAWYGADANAQNGRPAGNYASVKITAPVEYDETFLNGTTKVKIDNRPEYTWDYLTSLEPGVDDTTFTYYPVFNEETRSHTVTVTWETGNVQVFTIELADTATLEAAPQGTIGKGDSTGGDLTYTLDEANHNKIIIDGNIAWYGADANAQNGRPAGNYASVKITAPVEYDETFLNGTTKVKIDNRPEYTWDYLTSLEPGVDDTTFTYYPVFNEETRSHTVTVTWETGNVQVFTIELADTATLQEPQVPQGTITQGHETIGGADIEYNISGNVVTIGGKVKWSSTATPLISRAGNYAVVRVTAPADYDYDFLSTNTKIKVNNSGLDIDWYQNSGTSNQNLWMEDGTSFIYYSRFDEDTSEHTLTVTWEEGNVQVFTINLAEGVTLEAAPKGTIETADGLDYTIYGDTTIRISGEIPWYEENAFGVGSPAGNYVSLKIIAPDIDIYTTEFLNTNTKYYRDGNYNDMKQWNELGTFMIYYQKYSSTTEDHHVVVDWEWGNSQHFWIVLTENTTLQPEY